MDASTTGFEALSRHFPAGWESKASEFGIRFGNRVGAKLERIDQLLQMFFHQVAHDLSLETAAAWAASTGLPAISGVALHKRVRTLGPYLRWMLREMVGTARSYEPERWGGYDLRVVDGSTVVRPGHDRATARLLYVMRLADLRLTEVHVTDDQQGETFTRLEDVQADQLFIGDRVYSSPPGIFDACARGADVLVRFNWASLPLFDARGERFHVFDHLSKVKHRPREWTVEIRNGTERLSGRIVVEALPPAKAKQARRKLRKEKPSASKNTVAAAGYRMIFTTAPATRLPTRSVLDLYPLRWQVELQIKRDKSIFNLKYLPNYLLETIESWLYAKLILAHLTRRIADEAIEDLPPCAVEALEAA